MDILLIIKVKILMLVKWSYMFPYSYWLLSVEWLAYFEHIVKLL